MLNNRSGKNEIGNKKIPYKKQKSIGFGERNHNSAGVVVEISGKLNVKVRKAIYVRGGLSV